MCDDVTLFISVRALVSGCMVPLVHLTVMLPSSVSLMADAEFAIAQVGITLTLTVSLSLLAAKTVWLLKKTENVTSNQRILIVISKGNAKLGNIYN